MTFWLTPSEIAELDGKAVLSGTPELVLMERAGFAVADVVSKIVSRSEGTVVVFVGPGNNGGDGFVAARLLLGKGYSVIVRPSFDSEDGISKMCRVNMERFLFAGGTISREPVHSVSLAVDAILGVSFRGNLRDGALTLAKECSSLNAPVVSVDIPTGVDGLSGHCDPHAVSATLTVTLVAPKLGLLLPPGCAKTGTLLVGDIGIQAPENKMRRVMTPRYAKTLLPERPVYAHKGTFGKVLVLAGSEKMPGAPQMAAMGALRSGCGLVEICVPLPASPAIAGRIPEALSSYFLPGDITSLPEPGGYSVAVIGPGMGNTKNTARFIRHILATWEIPLVLDADALNVIDSSLAEVFRAYPADIVITPHPGELRRLTGCGEDINARFSAADKLARALKCSVLLKGHPSQIFSSNGQRTLVTTGNDALSTGGSGDLLAGIIAGFIAQGTSPSNALSLGSFLLGLTADILASESSSRSVLPSDVAKNLGRAISSTEKHDNYQCLSGNPHWTRV